MCLKLPCCLLFSDRTKEDSACFESVILAALRGFGKLSSAVQDDGLRHRPRDGSTLSPLRCFTFESLQFLARCGPSKFQAVFI